MEHSYLEHVVAEIRSKLTHEQERAANERLIAWDALPKEARPLAPGQRNEYAQHLSHKQLKEVRLAEPETTHIPLTQILE